MFGFSSFSLAESAFRLDTEILLQSSFFYTSDASQFGVVGHSSHQMLVCYVGLMTNLIFLIFYFKPFTCMVKVTISVLIQEFLPQLIIINLSLT